MRSPLIVVVDVFVDRPLQVLVAKNQSVIQAFVADTAHPALCDRISLRRLYRCTDLRHSQRFDASIELGAEAAVTVVDQEFWRLC